MRHPAPWTPRRHWVGSPHACEGLELEGSTAAPLVALNCSFPSQHAPSLPGTPPPRPPAPPTRDFSQTSSFQLNCSGKRPAFSVPSLSPQGSEVLGMGRHSTLMSFLWSSQHWLSYHSNPQFSGSLVATGKLSEIQVATSRMHSM